MPVHPSAIVSSSARLGAEVSIGPFAIVEADTELGDCCQVEAGAQIRRGSRLGSACLVGSGAIVGGDPQFRGFDHGIFSGVEIGPECVLREYVTIHRSIHEGEHTRLGSKNFLMAGAHVGHDSVLGDENTLANNVMLGGHVRVGNRCFFGGGTAFHQFVRVGDHVMTQGQSGFSLDLPPYVIASGINIVNGINLVGLRRAGFPQEERDRIKKAFRALYHQGNPLDTILGEWGKRELSVAEQNIYDFLKAPSKKGLCRRTSRSPGIG